MFKIFQKRKAQNLLEYTMLIGIVTLAFVSMSTAMKRGIQGVVKLTADQIGEQRNADQFLENQSLDSDASKSYLVYSNSLSESDIMKSRIERLGNIQFVYNETTHSYSNSLTDLGYQNKVR